MSSLLSILTQIRCVCADSFIVWPRSVRLLFVHILSLSRVNEPPNNTQSLLSTSKNKFHFRDESALQILAIVANKRLIKIWQKLVRLTGEKVRFQTRWCAQSSLVVCGWRHCVQRDTAQCNREPVLDATWPFELHYLWENGQAIEEAFWCPV